MHLLNMLASYSTYYDYGTSYGTSSVAAEAGVAAGILAILGMLFLPLLIIGILSIVILWKLFVKIGEPGWKSIIPIYNIVILLQAVDINPLFILVAFIPVVGNIASFLLMIVLYIRLAKGFGKDTGFVVGLVLLSFIFQAILAFGKSTWDKSKIDTSSLSFLNKASNVGGSAPAGATAGTPTGAAAGTPEDPWVAGAPSSAPEQGPTDPTQSQA